MKYSEARATKVNGEILEINEHYCHYLCECGNEFYVHDEIYSPGGDECSKCKKLFIFNIDFQVKNLKERQNDRGELDALS